jgi:hypothetical protein
MQFQAIELQQRSKKLVWWHTKPLLIEHRACHRLNGGCRILGHMAKRELRNRHIALTQKVLQVLLRDLRRHSAQLCHGSTGKEGQHPISSTTLSYF